MKINLNQIFTYLQSEFEKASTLARDLASVSSSLFTFVVTTFLFSTLIVPQLNKLKDIRDKVGGIKFPTRDLWNGSSKDEREHRDELTEAGQKLEEYFREYEVKESHLRPFIYCFYLAFLGGLAWLTIVIAKTSLFWWLFNLVLAAILVFALRLYKVPVGKLRKIDWLANEAGLNPHNLWGVLRAGFYYSSQKNPTAPAASDKLYFTLSPDTFLTGWRYFFQVYDDEDRTKVYFVSFGTVADNKHTFRNISEEGVSYGLPMGGFPIYGAALNEKREVNFKLLIFAPVFPADIRPPFLAETWHTVAEETEGTYQYFYSGTYMSGSVEPRIEYSGKGLKLNNLTVKKAEAKDREFSLAVFQAIQGSFRKSRAIQSYYDMEGKLAERLTTYRKFLIWLKASVSVVKSFETVDLSKKGKSND